MASDSNRSSVQSRQPSANRLDRRAFLSAAGASSIALAGCLGGSGGESGDGSDGSGGEFDGETLRVALWSGAYKEKYEQEIAPIFEEETGATLEVVGRWADILADIRASPEDNPPYDVAISDNFYYFLAQQEGLFLELRDDALTNLDELYPVMRDVESTKYAAPIDADPGAIVYNTELDWTPSTWSDLLEDRAENIALESPWYPYPVLAVAIAMDPEARGENAYDPDNFDAIFETMSEMDVVKWFNGYQDLFTAMDEGLVDLAEHFHGLQQATVEADPEEVGRDLIVPDITMGYSNHWGVVRGTDQRDLAEHFLDFNLREDIQNKRAQSYFVGYSNKNVEYPEAVAENLPTSNDEFEDIAFPDFNRFSEHSDTLSQRFEEVKQQS